MKDLDTLLREDARQSIADDGFTDRVMRALPAPAAFRAQRLRPALIIGSAAVGSLLAALLAPAPAILQGFADVMQLRGFTPAAVTALAMGGALLVSAVVLAVESD